MFVVHGSWLPGAEGNSGQLAVWAETSERVGRRPRLTKRLPSHPFAASADELREALIEVMPAAVRDRAVPRKVIARLPADGQGPIPSPSLPSDDDRREPTKLASWQVEALALAPMDAL